MFCANNFCHGRCCLIKYHCILCCANTHTHSTVPHCFVIKMSSGCFRNFAANLPKFSIWIYAHVACKNSLDFCLFRSRSVQINKLRERELERKREKESDKPQTNKSKTFPYKNQMKYRIIYRERTADKNYELPKNFSQAPNLRFYFYACKHKNTNILNAVVCVCMCAAK